MSKMDALLIAMVVVGVIASIVISAVVIISILATLDAIGWVVLGLGLLLTIWVAIGVYQYERHHLN